MKPTNKIIVILGPTSSGKSDLAVELALKYNGEVISADSRQVYKGLDIGTGKITEKEMNGIPHHLLDVASPKKQYTVLEFKTEAEKAIKNILNRGKLPIICGGTGFYIQALVDNVTYPEVPPNKELRKKLEKKSAPELFEMLLKEDPERALSIDPHNPRRLIRALEIADALGSVPRLGVQFPSLYKFLQIGLQAGDDVLKKRIRIRLLARLKHGMVEEAIHLHKNGLSWKRMEELGLEYRYLARYLQKKISETELIESIFMENWHYAKRQKTWFKKDSRIAWFNLEHKMDIEKEIKLFLKNS